MDSFNAGGTLSSHTSCKASFLLSQSLSCLVLITEFALANYIFQTSVHLASPRTTAILVKVEILRSRLNPQTAN